MNFKKNKKGVDLLNSTIIFILLNLLFFGGMFLFIYRVGSGATYYEQLYSKQIALLIDNSKPGTTLSLDVEVLETLAKKNNLPLDQIITITGNQVNVKATQGKGYSFDYFSNYKIDKSFSKGDDGRLILNFGIRANEANG